MKPLLLIHIPKCAGQSIQNNIDVPVECQGHALASEIDNLKDFYSFAVVRNPYDRFLSSYYFYKYVYAGTREIGKAIQRYYTFEKFVLDFDNFEYKNDIQFMPQYMFVVDLDGERIVDQILPFETLDIYWNLMIHFNLGIDSSELPHLNATKHQNFDIVYTDEMEAIVYDLFSKDFEMFAYER